MRKIIIPNDVFDDFKTNALCITKRRDKEVVQVHNLKYDKYCSDKTKKWISDNNLDIKLVGYFVKKNLNEIIIPDCLFCGKQLSQKDVWLEHQFCSHYCQTQSSQRAEKCKKTNLEKYGVEVPTQNKDVIEKRKRNNLKKYGVEHVTQTESHKLKKQQTLLEHYGVTVPFLNKEIKSKAVQSTIDHYGTDNPFKLEFFQQKAKQTKIERYGTEYCTQNPQIIQKVIETNLNKTESQWCEILEKRKKTNLERYGTEYSSSSQIVKDKIKQSCIDQYGVEYPAQTDKSKSSHKLYRFENFIKNLKDDNIELLTSKDALINTDCDLTFKCLKCGYVWTQCQTMSIQKIDCIDCKPKSSEELELLNFIRSIYNGPIITNSRTIIPHCELDIYLPDLKLAFEYNGSYYHSVNNPNVRSIDVNYHLRKTVKCMNADIRLVHVFDFVWKNRKDQFKNFIKSLVGDAIMIEKKDLYFLMLDDNQIHQFKSEYCIGDFNYNYCYGIFYKDEIISMISFRDNVDCIILTDWTDVPSYQYDIDIIKDILNQLVLENVYVNIDLSCDSKDRYERLGFNFNVQIMPIKHDIDDFEIYDCGYLRMN